MKRKLFFALAVFSMAAGACSNGQSGEEASKTYNSVADGGQIEIETPDVCDVETDYAKFQSVSESQEYNSQTDDQYSVWYTYKYAQTDDGIYYLGENGMIYYYDKESGTVGPLCSKPECTHEAGSDCDAYISGTPVGLYYYEGYLYLMRSKPDEDNTRIEYLQLYRLSLDGTELEKICDIATAYMEDVKAKDNGYTVCGTVHRGYLYYCYNFGTGGGVSETTFYNNNSHILFRVKLDGSEEPEGIMKLKLCGDMQGLNMKGIGSYVYFADTDEYFAGELYRYNTESGIIEDIGIYLENSSDYTLIDDFVYYKKEYNSTEIYCYNIATNETSLFADLPETAGMECWDIYSDTETLYAYYIGDDGSWLIKGVDSEGNVKAEYTIEETYGEELLYAITMNDSIIVMPFAAEESDEGMMLYDIDKNSDSSYAAIFAYEQRE